MKKAKTINFRW